ncbi:hypothetical protein HDV00_008618 [Rhizophlyctis rosea]|nr:hypothetical protein HDV00_008618 [Rhizophlyctis rosea]
MPVAQPDSTDTPQTLPLLPVVVFIHGGSFTIGSGSIQAFNATDLASSLQAVVVTINYRLSVFGFLNISTVDKLNTTNPTRADPTNFGILDQRLAIQWVVDNIAAYGGDSAQITLMGQSAGATSAVLHKAHPTTAGHIKNLILMSLPGLLLTSREVGVRDAMKFADAAGCADADCLRTKSMRQLLTAVDDGRTGGGGKTMVEDFFLRMIPIVDGVDVVDSPWNILRNPAYMQSASILLGGMSNETANMVQVIYARTLSTPTFNIITNAIFGAAAGPARELYNVDHDGFLADRKPYLIDMTTDWLFHCPMRQVLNDKGSVSTARIWQYYMEAPWMGSSHDAVGRPCGKEACHSTDVIMAFWQAADDHTAAITSQLRAYLKEFVQPHHTDSLAPSGLLPWTSYTSNNVMPHQVLPLPNPASTQTSLPYAPVLEQLSLRDKYCDYWDRVGYDGILNHSLSMGSSTIILRPDKPTLATNLLAALYVLFAVVLGLQLAVVFVGFYLERRMARQFAMDQAQRFPGVGSWLDQYGGGSAAELW